MIVVLVQFISKADVDVFRLPEFEALCDIACDKHKEPTAHCRVLGNRPGDLSFTVDAYDAFVERRSPLLFAQLCSVEVARLMAERSVLIKSVLLPFVAGAGDIDSLAQKLVLAAEHSGEGLTALGPYVRSPTFRYEVESIERKLTSDEKKAAVQRLQCVPHAGKVDLEDPEATVFRVLLLHDSKRDLVGVFHGAVLSESRRNLFLDRFSLKARRYIGTTSMPPELTFLMANLARIRKNDLVVDPFAGTGATLLSAAFFGASTMGFDMDGRVLRGGAIVGAQAKQALAERVATRAKALQRMGVKGESDEALPATFRQNFVDYGLPAADAARLNFSVACRAFAPAIARHRNRGFLDAIVSDPPYGIREQQRRVVNATADDVELRKVAPWACGDLMLDLVSFAAVSLVCGGHLVYWHPTCRISYTDAEIPTHPCFERLSNEEQALSIKLGRRLVVMRKIRDSANPEQDLALARDSIASASDVRRVMDDTSIGNEQYFAYREKRRNIREARESWRNAQSTEPSSAQQRLSKAEIREANMRNRARNVAARETKQQAHDERQRRDSDLKRSRDEGQGSGLKD
uniref:tRNA (guanine(10)-N(2))-methyltransferase n=1 Tax=Neobodo designis TaxID=312471 RepID=A0A7S1PXZ3_NEODS|eukprot:CAMPEP_0174830564 /NCGR_PEP_ID=MMETSP1114-20130205/2590_1 /TAXON_ID=312471 /ORGANISM="Neobodo designis, Strain CCAP 1951/1" /LENGTH=575 /DNA_ID=CAMNT_0016064365 /DNA_START=27 /DNA_END=1754 /DNA_ORIENTATION=-